MLKESKNNLLPFEHTDIISDINLVKESQQIIKSNGNKFYEYILNGVLRDSIKSLPQMYVFLSSKVEYIENGRWSSFSGDDFMNKKIAYFIKELIAKNIIQKAIVYKSDNSNVIWFVMDEETHENSIKCIRELKKFINDDNIEFEYFLCDLDDMDDIKEDLELAKVKYEVI